MIFVGIDVAKDKHDCFITNSDGEVLFKSFTITNNLDGFDELYQKIESVMEEFAPKMLSAEEVKAIMTEKFADVIATGNKGQIMKAVMPEFKGKADGKVVQEVVAELLG